MGLLQSARADLDLAIGAVVPTYTGGYGYEADTRLQFTDGTEIGLTPVDPDPGKAQAQNIASTWDWSQAAQDIRDKAARQNLTKDLLDTISPDLLATIIRSLALLTMDELNILRLWITDFKAAVAASSSLVDLKTRVAALSNTGQRTKTQLYNALKNRVTSVDV